MKCIVMFLMLTYSIEISAQTEKPESLFDFWIGEWSLTWTNRDGTITKGVNRIEKIMDGNVIQEHFEDQNGFKGTSISVYNPREKSWHQAWADVQGSYYNFLGEVEEKKRIFKTEVSNSTDGQSVNKRMVFYNITPDSFTWDWEQSSDQGKSWQLLWRIFYSRKK